jgi:hypothetical protein
MGRRRSRGSGALLLVAAVSLVVAGALVSLAGSAAWSMFAQDPAPIASGDRVTVSRSGMTLLRDEGGTGSTSCSITRGGERILLEETRGRSVDLQTGRFVVAASTAGSVRAGTYDFECTAGGTGLYAARRIAFGDAALVGVVGVVALAMGLALGTLGLVLLRRPVSSRAG